MTVVSTLLLCVNVAANDGDAILASFENEGTLDGWAVRTQLSPLQWNRVLLG